MATVVINSAGTYYFNDNDTYIISPSVSGTVTFRPAAGTSDNLNVQINQTTTNTVNIVTEDWLLRGEFNLNMTVADGVKAGNVSLSAQNSNNVAVSVGTGSSIGNLTTSVDNGDTLKLTAGDGATIGNVTTGDTVLGVESGGADTISLGNNVTIGNITTRAGADVITTGTGTKTGVIDAGGGNDTITLGTSNTTGNIIGYDGNDSITVGSGSTTGTIDGGAGSETITLGDSVKTGSILLGTGGTNGDILTAGNNVTVNGNITQAVSDDYSKVTFGDNAKITGSVELNGGKDTLTLGANSTVAGHISMGDDVSLDDADVLNIGTTSSIGGYINTGNGNDYVGVGSASTLSGGSNAINTYSGSDTVAVGQDVVITNPVSQGILTPNNDLVVIDYGIGGKEAFLAALAAQGFTDPDGNGQFFGSSNSTFTYGGITYNLADFIQGIPCFATGTLIETDRGAVAIETLAEGDRVMTRDNGLQPIRWIGRRALSAETLSVNENLRPIRIRRHALGTNLPSSDLLVSPQHRVLVRSAIAQKMFGTSEVLVAAKQLCQIEGIDIATDLAGVEYVHMLFDRHEVVISNGAETESLYTGPEALKSVGPAALAEIFAIFPELADRDYTPVAARPLASGRMARKLAVRHAQNHKALVN